VINGMPSVVIIFYLRRLREQVSPFRPPCGVYHLIVWTLGYELAVTVR